MMLFLHLFNQSNLTDLCHPLLYVGNEPFVHILSRASSPVAIFIILSGYGLSVVYAKGTLNLISQLKRLLKLYIHYWIILLIFVSIGCFVRPNRYPGDWQDILLNVSSWSNSYNSEHWFLFPYAMISLTAYPIFKVIDKLGNLRALLFFLLLTLISNYITSRYIAVYKLYDSPLAHLLTYIGFFFCFSLGAIMFRVSRTRSLKIEWLTQHPSATIVCILLLIAFRCLFTTGAFHGFYCFFLITLFLHLPLHHLLRGFLLEMGKYSMPMWLIHSFFCYHLFKDFIYGFRYPILIFIVLLAISYVSSIPVVKCAKIIIKKVL